MALSTEEFFTLLLLEHGTNPTPVYEFERNYLREQIEKFWWEQSTVMMLYIPTASFAEIYLRWLFKEDWKSYCAEVASYQNKRIALDGSGYPMKKKYIDYVP